MLFPSWYRDNFVPFKNRELRTNFVPGIRTGMLGGESLDVDLPICIIEYTRTPSKLPSWNFLMKTKLQKEDNVHRNGDLERFWETAARNLLACAGDICIWSTYIPKSQN